MKAATKIELLKKQGFWNPKHYNPEDLCVIAKSCTDAQTLENIDVVEDKPKKKSRKKKVEQ